MAKKRESGLGRGLDALMGGGPSSLLEQSEGSGITTLPIAKVEANASQPRKQFDPDALSDLAESIATHGILQPITVRRLPSGYYQIISGELSSSIVVIRVSSRQILFPPASPPRCRKGAPARHHC